MESTKIKIDKYYYRDWRRKNPDKVLAARSKYLEKKRGAVKRPEFCEVCGRKSSGKTRSGNVLHWDHDHKTGKFRGWLCDRCNKALGFMEDNALWIKRLAEYLEK